MVTALEDTTTATAARGTQPWENTLSALITINSRLLNENIQDTCLREVNFMSYELAAQCDDKSDEETFQVLNQFFFEIKKFKLTQSPVLLRLFLSERRGCSIGLALLYIHLAQNLDLRLQLVHWPLHAILRWEHDGKCCYVDLEQNGKILSEDELLGMINKHKEQVRTLSAAESYVQYLAYLSLHFRQSQEKESLHKTLDFILTLEPENTRFLAERALLRKDLGLIREAICDFKRYFSFTDMAAAPAEIVAAYEELRALAPAFQ